MHRQAASTEGAAQALQRRTGDCVSVGVSVRLWRAAGGVQCCNGERSMAVGGGRGLAGGGAGGLVEFLASAFTWSCRRLRMADGGWLWLMTGARRRVALRCVALRWLVYSASGPGGDKQHQNTNSTAQGDALDNDSRLTCVEGSTGVSECSA